jgi:hypothetical protein
MKPIRSAEPRQNPIQDPGFNAEVLVAAAREAVSEALARHKAKGDSVVVWRDDRVVILQPEEIDL